MWVSTLEVPIGSAGAATHLNGTPMNSIKSLVLIIVALSSTSALAHDGSERASPAAQKMRIAQEERFNQQNRDAATEYVRADEQPRADQPKKSEG